MIGECYLPLITWIVSRRKPDGAMLLGINGAQGTGKSTLADFLELGLRSMHGWRVAVLSIDDFYLTKTQRAELAATVHPLLATRGVPGTHDVRMLSDCLSRLAMLGDGQQYRLPRFDKSRDDRADATEWPAVIGPLDLIILEGWCVGSTAEEDVSLVDPVNDLERDEDPSGTWRRYVNDQLRESYMPVFTKMDALVFLQAPSFDAVFRWRLEQEQKLAKTSGDAPGTMDAVAIARFIQFYERITRTNIGRLPDSSDVVIELDEQHNCVAWRSQND